MVVMVVAVRAPAAPIALDHVGDILAPHDAGLVGAALLYAKRLPFARIHGGNVGR